MDLRKTIEFEQDIIEILKKYQYLRNDVENFVMSAKIEIWVNGEHKPTVKLNDVVLDIPKITLELSPPNELKNIKEVK